MYYDWTVIDEGTLANWGGGNMPCRAYYNAPSEKCRIKLLKSAE